MNDEPNHILKVKSQTKSLEITLEAQNSALLSVRIQLSNSTSVRMRGLPLEIPIPIPIDDKDKD